MINQTIPCRLCDANSQLKFSHSILGKYDVSYYKCSNCESLQTEEPYWLDEAYTESKERFDTGKASRTLYNAFICSEIFKVLDIKDSDKCLDIGGGTGLFSRLMRDLDFNFFTHDKYSSSEFMQGFKVEKPELLNFEAITIFEVVEHFAYPKEEFNKIFSSNPNYLLLSTELFNDQGKDWHYLIPDSGQHIFFYSGKALSSICTAYDMHGYALGTHILLAKKPLSNEKINQINHIINNKAQTIQNSSSKYFNTLYASASKDLQSIKLSNDLAAQNKRIAIDGVFFKYNSGIARVWRSIIEQWSTSSLAESLLIIDRDKTAPKYENIKYIDFPGGNLDDEDAILEDICASNNVALFISTYYTKPTKTPSVLLVLDMIPEVMNFDLSEDQWVSKKNAINYANSYVCISKNTADDLIKYYPETANKDVSIAHCGTNFKKSSTESIAEFKTSLGIHKPYIILSHLQFGYKNSQLFLAAFQKLGYNRNNFEIVITNSRPIADLDLSPYFGDVAVHHVVLSDADLQTAYSGAHALIYPSLYEGFGLPPLEAMTCGCPVITCHNSSIPEVVGDSAIYVSATDGNEMAQAILQLSDPSIRDFYIKKGLQQSQEFSWKKMAHNMELAFSSALKAL
jgi:glycosyltransferase involved in cell wall biosynthesis